MIEDKQLEKQLEKQTPKERALMQILAKREFVVQSIEAYERQYFQNREVSVYEIKTRLRTLFRDVEPDMEFELELEEYQDLCKCLSGDTAAEIFDAFDIINKWLYKKGLMDIFKKAAIL